MEERDSTAALDAHLRTGGTELIAALLRHRPDLAEPPPIDLDDLVARAVDPTSLRRAQSRLSQAEDQLLHIVACLPPGATDDDLARALPEGTDLEAIAPTFDQLTAASLAWRHDGHIHVPDAIRAGTSSATGLPLAAFEDTLTLDHLKHAVRTLRATLTEADVTGELPPWGPPRKAGLLAELTDLLAADDSAAAALRGAPPEAAALLHRLLDGPHSTTIDHPLVHHRVAPRRAKQLAYRPDYADSPAYWLFERGLILPEPGTEADADVTRATVPRELLLSWLGGRPVTDLALTPPTLATGAVDPAYVDQAATDAVTRLLQGLADLVEAWTESPPTTLKDGGLGPLALRPVAALVDRDLAHAARIVELAHLAGLVTPPPARTGAGPVTVTPAAEAWLATDPARRWSQLVTAWRRAGTWPSRAGRSHDDGDTVAPALTATSVDPVAARARAGVLDALQTLEVGQATGPDALAAHVHWHRPADWASTGTDPHVAIGWTAEEADLLGLTAQGTLSSFGRAHLDGDVPGAEAALEALLPPVATTFTLQTDLTAVAIGRLEHDVLTELRLLAEVESTGSASTFRFTDASLRRAFDAGRDAESVTAFLDAHAPKGIPSALAYLIADVDRRHGHLTVASAATVVTSDDDAVLAEATSHRATRDLQLQLLAPSVATSPRPPEEVLATLRDAGFLPVPGDEPIVSVTVGSTATGDPGPPTPPTSPSTEAVEPLAVAPDAADGPLDASTAHDHAQAILDATPDPEPVRSGPRR